MREAEIYSTDKLVEKLNSGLTERDDIPWIINSDLRLELSVVIEALSSESRQKAGKILLWRNRPLFKLQIFVTQRKQNYRILHPDSLSCKDRKSSGISDKTLFTPPAYLGLGMAEQAITTALAPMYLESVLANDERCAEHERFTGRKATTRYKRALD